MRQRPSSNPTNHSAGSGHGSNGSNELNGSNGSSGSESWRPSQSSKSNVRYSDNEQFVDRPLSLVQGSPSTHPSSSSSSSNTGNHESESASDSLLGSTMDSSTSTGARGFWGRSSVAVFGVHLTIALYSLCFWIQVNTLPFQMKRLQVDTVTFGYLQTTFSLLQLSGGPVYGRCGDLFGGRTALFVSTSASALSYYLLSEANSVYLLFFSRVPTLLQHSMQGAQMVIAALHDPRDRTAAIGRLSLSYGIGMVTGPFLGGWVAKVFDESTAALVACAGSLISIAIIYFMIPGPTASGKADTARADSTDDSTPSSASNANSKSKSRSSTVSISDIFAFSWLSKTLRVPGVPRALGRKMLISFPLAVFQSVFSIGAIDYFHLDPQQSGSYLSFVGLLMVIINGFLVGRISAMIPERFLFTVCSATQLASLVCIGSFSGMIPLYAFSVPLCISSTVMVTSITASLTKLVDSSDVGATLGLDMAVNSFVRVISPTFAGWILAGLLR